MLPTQYRVGVAAIGNIKDVLTANIKRYRKGLYTQRGLAARAGLPVRTVNAIEKGRRWPSHKTIRAISNALGIPETALFQDVAAPGFVSPSAREALDTLERILKAQGKL